MSNPLIKAAITLLEVLFLAGIVGSALVILLAGIDDVRSIVSGKDEEN